jgi:phosphate transport system substrate-binding protein
VKTIGVTESGSFGTPCVVCIVAAVCAGTLCAVSTGCSRKQTPLSVASATSFQPAGERLAEAFSARRPDIRITVQQMDSASGIHAVLTGVAAIGVADHAALPPEAGELRRIEVARDGIAVIVHPANAVTNLTTEQIRCIFGGTFRNWKEVGGPDRPLHVVSRESGSGTRHAFEQLLAGIAANPNAVVQDTSRSILETVANDRDAVGYVSRGLVTPKVKAVRVDGSDCAATGIAQGTYRLARPVAFLTRDQPAGAAKDFLEYTLSAEGQAIIREAGLVPVR